VDERESIADGWRSMDIAGDHYTISALSLISGGTTKMAVKWNKDADAALAEAKAAKRPLLVDFSAAPA